MHRNRSWNHIVGIKGIWKMTSKITPVKLGDISEKTKTGRPKGRGKHSRHAKKKNYQPKFSTLQYKAMW